MRTKGPGKFSASSSHCGGFMLTKEKNKLRLSLMELAEACPFDHCNPEDCPLSPLRKMSPKQRSRWFKALTEKDLAYLATYHYTCLATKVKPKG
jgi:hypothetical protein